MVMMCRLKIVLRAPKYSLTYIPQFSLARLYRSMVSMEVIIYRLVCNTLPYK